MQTSKQNPDRFKVRKPDSACQACLRWGDKNNAILNLSLNGLYSDFKDFLIICTFHPINYANQVQSIMGKDDTIALEPFTENDFNRFIHWIDNERFMCQFAGTIFTFPITSQQLSDYVSATSRMSYKVIEVETGRVIGHAEIDRINPRNKNARLCRILIAKKEDRNKGYGQMLIRKLLNIGFKEMNLHRIDLGVFDFNASAIRTYEKCGFKKEGLLRDSTLIENQFYSVYNMSILRHEWEDAANLPES